MAPAAFLVQLIFLPVNILLMLRWAISMVTSCQT
jgi:hypothetical protein